MAESAYKVPTGETELESPQFSVQVFLDEQGRLAWVPHIILGITIAQGDALPEAGRRTLISRLKRQLYRDIPAYRVGAMNT